MTTQYPGTLPLDLGIRKAYDHRAWLLSNAEAVRDAQSLLYYLFGGVDGVFVLGTPPTTSLKAIATVAPSMSLDVLEGYALAYETVWRLNDTQRLTGFVAPVSSPRIDLVELNLATRALVVKTGVEAGSPATPAVDTDCIPIAAIHWRVGATSIKDTDDTTNAWIEDLRVYPEMVVNKLKVLTKILGAGQLNLQAGPSSTLNLVDHNGVTRITLNGSTFTSVANIIPSGSRNLGGASSPWSTIYGNTVEAGQASTTRGVLKAHRGASTNTPGVVDMIARSGNEYFGWFTDEGHFRRHTALPTADTDGRYPFPVSFLLTPLAAKLPGSNPAVRGTFALATPDVTLDTLDFDETTEQTALWVFPLPLIVNGTSFYARVYWIPGTGASSGQGVALSFRGSAYGDNSDPNAAFGSWPSSTVDTVQTVGRVHVQGFNVTIVNGGNSRFMLGQVRREPGHASDNMAGKARIIGIELQF